MFFCAGLNNGHMLHSSKEGKNQSKESFQLNQEDWYLPVCAKKKEKQNKQKNHKQNKKHRQKQMGMLFFRHIYKPKICGFSVILATMGDFSDNIFLRAAFGGAIETPVTTSTSSPSTSTWTSASGAVTFSDALQSYTR